MTRYLLDTNVLSELRKIRSGKADAQVARWSQTLKTTHLFISVITIQELETGVWLKALKDAPQGGVLRKWLDTQVYPAFAGRILPVTTEVAQCCAKLQVPQPHPHNDSYIAATALVHHLTVATRNVADFRPFNVPLFNPWRP